MKTASFIDLLKTNVNKNVLFSIDSNYMVPKGYHITELMRVKFDSVDCGSQANSWQETLMQIWQPIIPEPSRMMTADKALKIINQVISIQPLDMQSELFIEYGDSQMRVAKFGIDSFTILKDDLVFSISAPNTTCKARDRDLLINSNSSACCATDAVNRETAKCC